jgi:hypothetical protein
MGEGVRIMMEGVNLTFLRTFVNVTMSAQYTPILYIYIYKIYIYIIYIYKIYIKYIYVYIYI